MSQAKRSGTKAARAKAAKRAVKQPAAKRAAAKRTAAKQSAAKPAAAKPAKRAAKPAAAKQAAKPAAAKPAKRAAKPAKRSVKHAITRRIERSLPAADRDDGKAPSSPTRWPAFVEEHGVVLASARGLVPSVAEAIAGEPIVGSWWSHPKAQIIFDALSTIDDDGDIGCFKLVDKKITFVHRRLWPALTKLARAGVLASERVAAIQQEHMPTGEHRNVTVAFPDWVPADVAAAAEALSIDEARRQLGAWA